MSLNVLNLADKLRTEADAYLFLEELRWHRRPICPHCGSIKTPYFLQPTNGKTRKTTRGSTSERRVWKCSETGCRRQFSVLTGTIFHGSHIPVRTWVFLVFEFASSKNGVSAREIQRKYNLTPKSAWYAMHRLREATRREPIAGPLSGRVVADETWYGGKPKNRHGHKQSEHMQGEHDKTPIMALVSRETGEVRSQVVPNVKGETLRSVLGEHVDPATTHLHTDQALGYRKIAGEFAGHTAVNHNIGEYVRDGATTNQAETFFSQLKRSLDGTHHAVSREHLDRYLAEFDFRFSTCKETDTERMERLVSRVGGRRLTYRQPAGA